MSDDMVLNLTEKLIIQMHSQMSGKVHAKEKMEIVKSTYRKEYFILVV
ncbi:hypothetical protein AALP_AA4G190100 [Arabis alpina]|uniref:Uncharacterized protein n=1 Tax=Arabis alpina TaxID=50452 RepID=A0A087H470_ARAAL|nr:hypothetical protein AALP_AA4G190100 [Arabis alpina]